jgi:acetyl esterase/lipase
MQATHIDHAVDTELWNALVSLPNFNDLSRESLLTTRQALSGNVQTLADDGDVLSQWVTMPSATVAEPSRAILYTLPHRGPKAPAILHAHGGGFVAGSALRDDAAMRSLVRDHKAIVLSVEYRLAPESPFPAGLEDCYQALRWLHERADELHIDTQRIATHGVSAGAGLMAALALLARDRREFKICYQLLLAPMLDDRTSNHGGAGKYVWTVNSNRFAWDSYLGAERRADVSEYAAPARARDLSALPKTFIAVGGIDLFADEDIRFANGLLQAGIETELHVYPGAYHGFHLVSNSGVARAYADDARRALRRGLVGHA